jgi:hypothetical protein
MILDEEYDSWFFLTFLVTLIVLGFVLPTWKCVLTAQNAKVLLRGNWEIPSAASMQLDYVLNPASHQVKGSE